MNQKFKDLLLAISYKESNRNGIPNGKDINHKILDKRWALITQYLLLQTDNASVVEENYSHDSYQSATLEAKDNCWFIKPYYDTYSANIENDNSLYLPEADELYLLVVMPDNTLKIAKQDMQEYNMLSHYTKYARYAAEVCFDDSGNIISLNKISYTGLSLENINNHWFIFDNESDKEPLYIPEADELYIFVTMLDGTIRIAKRATHGHVILSDYAKYIKYAGEVCFDNKGNIKYWNNNSLSYCPPPVLAEQSGLGDFMRSFKVVIDRNDPNKNRGDAFPDEARLAKPDIDNSAVKIPSQQFAAKENKAIVGNSFSPILGSENFTAKTGLKNLSLFSKTKLRRSSSSELWLPTPPISPNFRNETIAKESSLELNRLRRSPTI